MVKRHRSLVFVMVTNTIIMICFTSVLSVPFRFLDPFCDKLFQSILSFNFSVSLYRYNWMTSKEYEELLSVLPLSTVDYAFAYGSGALQQKGEDKSKKMVDFIISTNDPLEFHKENLEKNPSHYSLLSH
ncbi:unnamed protein product [Cylicocyclus nassatus]|uniref:Phosphatidate cytidylyltransferase, mitochondrial n=1 Tax=Cylicocyclus nassatus TaxID=53992 RepID=A0AA36GMT5_CYLNA|nr:unnamed protein product [Cylicocyclus nassatus]